MKIDPTIYLIDDDVAIRDALMLLLNLRGMSAEAFSSAEYALAKLNRESHGCVLTDLRMPGMSGLELLAEINAREISLPVVLLTAHGDVATTRAALRGGAFDFLEKPIDEDILVDVLTHAISEDARGHQKRLQTETQLARINTLTQRERQVLTLLGRGLQNREIAIELSISPRTVEVYKARMMEKLDCSSIADVVKMSLLLDSPGHG
jgi:FixJ family two-component response regulator